MMDKEGKGRAIKNLDRRKVENLAGDRDDRTDETTMHQIAYYAALSSDDDEQQMRLCSYFT